MRTYDLGDWIWVWFLLWAFPINVLPLVFELFEVRLIWRWWGLVIWFLLIRFQRWHWRKLQNQLGHLVSGHYWNPASFFSVWGLQWRIVACKFHSCFHLSQAFLQSLAPLFLGDIFISNIVSCWVVICFLDFWLAVPGVVEERYWFTSCVIFLNSFRIRFGFLREGSFYWRCLWFYINSLVWLRRVISFGSFISRVNRGKN